MKKCPPGKYFCTKREKCMPIPRGYHIGYRGWLEPDEDGNGNGKKSKNSKTNGNGSSHSNGSHNGNGNGGGGNGGGVSEHRLLSVAEAATTLPRINGQTLYVTFQWRGKYMSLQMFFPELKMPTRAEVQDAIVKVYPGSRVSHYDAVLRDPTKPILQLPDT